MDFTVKQIEWIASIIIVGLLFGSAYIQIEKGKDVKDDTFYAKELALTFNEVVSAKGKVAVTYDNFPDFELIGDEIIVHGKTIGRSQYIKGDKVPLISRNGDKLVITNG